MHQTLLSISPQSSRIHLQIFNSSNHDIFLPDRTELGRLELVRTVTPLEANFKGFSQNNFSNDTASTSDSVSPTPDVSVDTSNMKSASQAKTTDHQDIVSQIDLSHLITEQAQMAREMLSEERDSFSISDSDFAIGCAEGLQMEINLKDNIPVQKSYQSIPRPLYSEVKAYIEDLLNQGFITKSKSSYSSPVVCVRKRDNSLRLCVDFRALNQKTIMENSLYHGSNKLWEILAVINFSLFWT